MNIPHILIVDDEQATRCALAECLSLRIQGRIDEATDSYQAMELVEKGTYDLILLDINMPGLSGMNVIKKAKELDKTVAFIVLTKLDSSALAEELDQLGAFYIPKPLSLKVVFDEVQKVLEAVGKYVPLNNA